MKKLTYSILMITVIIFLVNPLSSNAGRSYSGSGHQGSVHISRSYSGGGYHGRDITEATTVDITGIMDITPDITGTGTVGGGFPGLE